MKTRIRSRIVAVLVAAAALVTTAVPAAAELKVVVTIKPVHALVAGVMAGLGTPELLVTGSASPHLFALTPSGARALHGADAFFRVSPTVEPFTEKIVASLPSSVRVVTLADAAGVVRLSARDGDTFEQHDHDHDHDAESHAAPASAVGDGHVWLDAGNAKHMVSEIARVLTELSPQDKARIDENASRVTAQIDAVDKEISIELADVSGRPYVVFHDAYQYFERRYGLSPVGAITVRPETQPGARRLSEIRRKISGLGAVCVFAEPQYRPDVVKAIAQDADARTAVLDPEGALLEPGPGAYVELLRNLARSLKSCLKA